jgi:hypothetical protein
MAKIAVLPLLLLMLSVSVASVDLDCPLILKKHSKFDGVGVYAGRDYKAGEVVERCVTVSIPRSKSNPLTDMYVFSHTPEYTDLVLGYGMVYNTNANHSLRINSSLRPSARVAVGTPEGPPPLLDFYITAHYDIPKGQEMFTDYGGAPWFDEKGIPFLAAPEDDAGVLLPGCASGKAEIIGGRVYATQLIQVSPPCICLCLSVSTSVSVFAHVYAASYAYAAYISITLISNPYPPSTARRGSRGGEGARAARLYGGRLYA